MINRVILFVLDSVGTVSYTHLDVYKRQKLNGTAVAELRSPF